MFSLRTALRFNTWKQYAIDLGDGPRRYATALLWQVIEVNRLPSTCHRLYSSFMCELYLLCPCLQLAWLSRFAACIGFKQCRTKLSRSWVDIVWCWCLGNWLTDWLLNYLAPIVFLAENSLTKAFYVLYYFNGCCDVGLINDGRMDGMDGHACLSDIVFLSSAVIASSQDI